MPDGKDSNGIAEVMKKHAILANPKTILLGGRIRSAV